MVDTIIKDVVEDAATTTKIARAIEGITEVVVASEVGVEEAMTIVIISETEKGTEAHHHDQDTVGLEVLQVYIAGEDDGM